MRKKVITPPDWFLEWQGNWYSILEDLNNRYPGFESVNGKKLDDFIGLLEENDRTYIHRYIRLGNAWKELAWSKWACEYEDYKRNIFYNYDPKKKVIIQEDVLGKIKKIMQRILE